MARIEGKQKKLDFNRNNKLDKQDFKILAKINKGKKKNGVSKKSKIS